MASKLRQRSRGKQDKLKMRQARKDLDTFIRDNYRPGTGQSTERPGAESIVQDMPKKFADFFVNKKTGEIGNPTPGKKSRYFRKDGSLNEAGKYMLRVYSDDRPEYARQMNRLVTSSPEAARAYAERFPKTAFFKI